MPKATKKKNATKTSQRSLGASSSVPYQREGARLPCVGFKNQSTGWGSEDRSEPSPRFAYNRIHKKRGADNFQGHSLEKSLGASQVFIRRGSQNPVSQRVFEEHPLKLSRTLSREK